MFINPILVASVKTVRENLSIKRNKIFFVFVVTCVWPYALTPSSTCVNVLTDVNNCGIVGYKCDVNSKICSRGICQKTSIVQRKQIDIGEDDGIDGLTKSKIFLVTLPMNISLYNKMANSVTIMINGVSLFLISL
jgi:hypothetical protein